MPYLNWKTSNILPVLTAHPTLASQSRVSLSSEQRQELASELEQIFQTSGSELKLELPAKWTLYWQLRSGNSKLLLAHPQIDEWVASLYISAEHGKNLIERLRGATVGDSLAVSTLGTLGWGSNFELVIDFA